MRECPQSDAIAAQRLIIKATITASKREPLCSGEGCSPFGPEIEPRAGVSFLQYLADAKMDEPVRQDGS